MGMGEVLFNKEGYLGDLLESMKIGLQEEIQTLDREKILQTNERELYEYFVRRYTLEGPILKDESKVLEHPEDINIDVTGRFDYALDGDEGPHYVKGISITVIIPFDGDGQLFDYRPSSSFLNGVRGMIAGNEIHLTYQGVRQDMGAEKVKKGIENDINMIKTQLQNMSHEIDMHNQFIETQIKKLILDRKERISKDENLVSELGIPVRRREDEADTYTIPVTRKKPRIEPPKVEKGMVKREPILPEDEYIYILEVISRMALVMERSPKAFQDMDEESLRWQFLVPLNSHYEGIATGETFNYRGKTDILIRYEDKNIFIAECKIWHGPEGLNETINQLLGYTNWRDTKTAIILFNKNKNFSAVLSQIDAIVKEHPCFINDLGKQGDTSFRYIFHQPSDKERKLVLTVMAFDVPKDK